jgi:putative cardiolipin synthase
LVKLRAALAAHVQKMSDSPFETALRTRSPIGQLSSSEFFHFGDAALFYDDPAKNTEQSNSPEHRLLPKLAPTAESVQHELVVISPYFIPGKAGLEFFRKLRARGVHVVILTNSLASTDAVAVHAGYSRYRKDLVALGVELYELKPTAFASSRNSDEAADSEVDDSTHASLHAKTFIFDRERVFVGSLNLDPRSATLNTEIGVVFQSSPLASQMAERLLQRLPEVAWRVEAVPDPSAKSFKLNWITQTKGSTQRLLEEPRSSFSRGMTVLLVSWLPVESQL